MKKIFEIEWDSSRCVMDEFMVKECLTKEDKYYADGCIIKVHELPAEQGCEGCEYEGGNVSCMDCKRGRQVTDRYQPKQTCDKCGQALPKPQATPVDLSAIKVGDEVQISFPYKWFTAHRVDGDNFIITDYAYGSGRVETKDITAHRKKEVKK